MCFDQHHKPIKSFALCLALMSLFSPIALAQALQPLPQFSNEHPRRVELGKKLFHDSRLSKNQDVSCASCHPIGKGGVDGAKLSHGTGGAMTTYNTPSILNAGIVMKFGWEGVTQTLKEATRKALGSPKAMAMDADAVAERLKQDATYVPSFQQEFGALTGDAILDALVAYTRSLVTLPSPFDRYLAGEKGALQPDEIQGYQRFTQLGCVSCHQGVAIGGNMFARFGVMVDLFRNDPSAHQGRFNFTHDPADEHVFRVPSLRNVALTAPYFHDGRAPDLMSAVRTMGYVQLGIRLNDADLQVLIAFLKSLTGEVPAEALP